MRKASGFPDLPVARDDVFVGRQFGKAHRTAGVELLGRDSHLGAEAELAAVGEGRRDVDVDAGGVHGACELRGGLFVLGDDGFAVARRVAGDVREGLFGRCDGPDGEFVVEEFRAEMLFGRVFQQVGGVVSAEGRESLGVGVDRDAGGGQGRKAPAGRRAGRGG